MNNIRAILQDLPCCVQGFTVLNEDWYTVYINARLGYYGQQQTLEHELEHINHGDFYSNNPLEAIE